MSFVIGVDGGGTSTRAVLLDSSGVELGRAQVQGGVVAPGAADTAVQAVDDAVRQAASEAGLELPGAVLWAGLAGAGREDARGLVERALTDSGLARSVHVGTDAEAAFYDAFGESPGVLLIGGTGSIVWARGDGGEMLRVGGWGRDVGDEGSGYAIGLAALRRVLRADDGREPPTRLTEPVLERCGVSDPTKLVTWFAGATKGEVAAIAPLVADAAARLDTGATSIIEGAVQDLEQHVAAAIKRTEPWSGRAPLVLWGGLLAAGGPLRTPMLQALESLPVEVRDVELDPPSGAARLALNQL